MTDHPAAGDIAPLRDHLLSAGDARLRRIVAVVDALPARGDADALIAPLRPRLARLRPPRPITLTRLLFDPVEPLITPTAAWHSGSPAIPRAALAVLGDDLTAALGAEAAPLQARVAGHTMADADVVAECGAALWARAAMLLPNRPPPLDWTRVTTLSRAAHAMIAGPLAALLAEGAALHRLPELSGQAAAAEAERLLRHAATRGKAPLAMMLALLVRRLPRLHRLLQLADSLAPGDHEGAATQASDRVVAFLLSDVRGAVAPGAALPEAADQVRRSACLLEDLEVSAATAERPLRMQMVRAARQQLSAQCRHRLLAAVEQLAAPTEAPVESADLVVIEESARALRRLDAVGRRLGDADAYDRALLDAAGRLAVDRLLPQHARLRLAEILLGPDAALAMLDGGD